MIKIYKKTIILTSVAIAGLASLNYSSGPGLNGLSVTGAPFGNYPLSPSSGYCSSCHSGGNFSPTASVQLYMGTTLVTGNIVPGWNYTVRVTRSAVGLPVNGGWGFQLTCVNSSSSNANINAWGTAPAGTANRTVSSRNYIEHTSKISNATTQVNIPWTAPALTPGNIVKFYLALNTVNGDGGTSGDQPITTTAQFTQAPLPLTWLYFRGRENGTANVLEWAVSNELNSNLYTVERSDNGIDFTALGNIKASQEPVAIHLYTFADVNPYSKTYYRIRQTDINGAASFYNTIQMVRPVAAKTMHSVTSRAVQIKMNSVEEMLVTASIFNLEGRKIVSKNLMLQSGNNTIELDRPQQPGVYILTVSDAHNDIYRAKFSN